MCFYYAVAAALCQTEDPLILKTFVTTHGTPAGSHVKVADIGQVEDAWAEKWDLQIQVLYEDEKGSLLPVRASPKFKAKNNVVLLLFHTKSKNNDFHMHYALIENLDSVFNDRSVSTSGRTRSDRRYMCFNCMSALYTEEAYQNHIEFCHSNATRRVVLPNKGDTLSFNVDKTDVDGATFHKRTFNSAYTCVYDFEALQIPVKQPCSCSDEMLANRRKYEEECNLFKEMGPEERAEYAADLHMRLAEQEEDRKFLEKELLRVEMGDDVTIVERRKKRRRQQVAESLQEQKKGRDGKMTCSGEEEEEEAEDPPPQDSLLYHSESDFAEFASYDPKVTVSCVGKKSIVKGKRKPMRSFDELIRLAFSLKKMCNHKTEVRYRHVPYMVSYIIVSREGKVVEEGTYYDAPGEEEGKVAETFLECMVAAAKKFLPPLSPGEPLTLTKKEKYEQYAKSICYLCNTPMQMEERVLDHDHLTGELLGVAHSACNLKRREVQQLTCFAHNFSGYDSHLLVRALAKRQGDLIHRISAIPLNQEKFKCLTVNNRYGMCDTKKCWEKKKVNLFFPSRIKFIDSYAFLPDSLSKLTETLRTSNCAFPLLDDLVDTDTEKSLLLRKGVYPYSFATSVRKLVRCKKLPSRDAFANDLTGLEVTDEDYAHAAHVWNTFACQTMLDYSVLYVKVSSL